MADQLEKKIAEAKEKMFGSKQPDSSGVLLIVTGDAKVESPTPGVSVRSLA